MVLRGHDHEDRKERVWDHPEALADAQDHELGEPAGIHQNTDHRCLARAEPAQTGPREARGDLRPDGDSENSQADQTDLDAVDRGELGLETRDREEDREEEQNGEVLELDRDLIHQLRVARDDRAEDERAEDGVDSDLLGRVGAQQDTNEDQAEERRAQAALVAASRNDPSDCRAHDEEHRREERERQREGDDQVARAAGPDDRHDHREDKPREDILDRRAGEADDPNPILAQPLLREDAGQNGEGRDGQSRPEEERERQTIDVGPDRPVNRQGHEHATGERHREGEACDRAHDAAVLAHELGVQLQPDQEHEEDQPQLRDRAEGGQDLCGEEPVLGVRPDGAEHRRAEHDPRQDLADDSGLMNPCHREPRQSRRDDDGGDGKDHLREHSLVPPRPPAVSPLVTEGSLTEVMRP